MKIKRIAYNQFKGISDTLDLDKPTLLSGSMGSGKSGRLLGPQFAVTGSTPAGDRAEAAVKFGASRGFSVSVELDDGFRFTRGIKVDPRGGKVETILDIAGQSSIGVRDSDPIIKEHVGNFAPAFNISAFLDLSPDKRRDFVLDLCAKGGGVSVDKAEIVNRVLIEVCKAELGDATVDIIIIGDEPDLSDKLLSKLAPDRREIVESLLPKLSVQVEGDLTTAIASALTWAADVRKASKVRRDEGQAASRKMSEQRNEFEVVAATVGQLNTELDECRKQAEAIGQQIASQAGRQTAKESFEKDIDELKNKIEVTESKIQENKTNREISLTKLQQEASPKYDQCEADLAAHKQTKPTAQSNLLQDMEYYQKQRNSTNASLEKARNDLDSTEKSIELVERNPWRVAQEFISRILGYPDEIGPSAEEEIHKLSAFVNERIPRGAHVENLQSNREKFAACIEVDAAKQVEYEAAITGLQSNIRDTEQANSNWEQLAVAIKSDRDIAYGRVVAIKENISRCDHNHAAYLTALEQCQKSLVDKEARLSKLLDDGGYIDVVSLQEQKCGYSARIIALQEKIDSKTRYDVLVAELTKCTARAEREGNLHEIAKLFEVGIKTIRESAMADLVAPLVNRLDTFIASAMPGNKAYCSLVNRRSKPEFDLGWIVDGERKISLDAMSGGESTIFCAGLAYALVMLAGTALKLLLVEAAEVDRDAMALLLTALSNVSSDVSNIIVATHLYFHQEEFDPEMGLDSWNFVECERLPEAVAC